MSVSYDIQDTQESISGAVESSRSNVELLDSDDVFFEGVGGCVHI